MDTIVEQTLAIIKPDVIRRGLVSEALADIKSKFNVIKELSKHITPEEGAMFYAEHAGKGFFGMLTSTISQNESMILVLEGVDVIKNFRDFIGATNPANAADGTLRKKYGISLDYNSFHGSDSAVSAKREIAFFFDK